MMKAFFILIGMAIIQVCICQNSVNCALKICTFDFCQKKSPNKKYWGDITKRRKKRYGQVKAVKVNSGGKKCNGEKNESRHKNHKSH